MPKGIVSFKRIVLPVTLHGLSDFPHRMSDTLLWELKVKSLGEMLLARGLHRISNVMRQGNVSFERRVLLLPKDANFWSNSAIPLCKFEVHTSGQIEDQSSKGVEVYSACKIFGGDALGIGAREI
ncbi:putative poly(ADP-ribose) glycohydrolase 2 [Glycine soja]|nr:putative poly(ADP-ribose) glycohydrolase 2 [Glycine soja]